jgi:VanZ family protein
MPKRWLSLLRWGYWAFVLVVLVATTGPVSEPPGPPGSDKWEHFVTFYALALGAVVLFPRLALWQAAGAVIVYGGLIELIQRLPLVHRDCSLYDWLADIVGALGAVIPFAVSGLRARVAVDKS